MNEERPGNSARCAGDLQPRGGCCGLRWSWRSALVMLCVAAIGALVPRFVSTWRQYRVAVHLREIGGSTTTSWLGDVTAYESWGYTDASSGRRADYYPTDDDLAGLSELVRVRMLLLHGSHISDRTLQTVGRLQNVEYLDVTDTRITDAGLEYLQTLARLEMLKLTGTSVSGTGLCFLQGLEHLRVLELRDTPLCDEALPIIIRLHTLYYIDLSRTGVTDAGFLKLSEVPSFREKQKHHRGIALCGTRVSDNTVPVLIQFRGLDYLELSSTRITDVGFLRLTELASLDTLSVEDTEVSDTAVARFRELRPDVVVYHGRNKKMGGAGERKGEQWSEGGQKRRR